MNLLTLETTCDETAAAVVTDDRQVLASVVGPIKQTFFGHSGGPDLMGSNALTAAINWSQHALGFKPEDALLGLLGTVLGKVDCLLVIQREAPLVHVADVSGGQMRALITTVPTIPTT